MVDNVELPPWASGKQKILGVTIICILPQRFVLTLSINLWNNIHFPPTLCFEDNYDNILNC